MVKKAIDSIDTKEIMDAYSDYNSPVKNGSPLVNRFLGIEMPKNQPVLTRAKIAENSGSGAAVDGKSDNVAGASLTSTKAIDYQSALPQNKYAREARQKTDESMDDFYNEVARRISNVKDSRRSGPPTKSIATRAKGKTASAKLFEALAPPYKVSKPSSSASLAANNFDTNETYDTRSNYSASPEDFRSDGDVDVDVAVGVPTEENNWNEALASKAAANQAAEEAKKNIGKVPSSPFPELDKIAKKGSGSSGLSSGVGSLSQSAGMGISGSERFLAGNTETLAINPEKFTKNLDTLIDSVYMEKEKGIEGENTQHAEILLQLLGGSTKALTLKNIANKDHEVQVIRQANGLKLVRLGNMADKDYEGFVSSVEDTIIKYQSANYNEDFSGLLKRLKLAVESKSANPKGSESAVRYDEFVRR